MPTIRVPGPEASADPLLAARARLAAELDAAVAELAAADAMDIEVAAARTAVDGALTADQLVAAQSRYRAACRDRDLKRSAALGRCHVASERLSASAPIEMILEGLALASLSHHDALDLARRNGRVGASLPGIDAAVTVARRAIGAVEFSPLDDAGCRRAIDAALASLDTLGGPARRLTPQED